MGFKNLLGSFQSQSQFSMYTETATENHKTLHINPHAK